MKRSFPILLLLFCLGSSHMAWGQMPDIDVQFRWGSIQKAPRNSYLAKIVSAGTWGAYMLRSKPSTLFKPEMHWLEYYDANYRLAARHELVLPESGQLEDIISLKRQLYQLHHQPAGERSQLWIRPLSANGSPVAESRLLAEVPLHEQFRDRQFDLEFNRDSSFLLLYNQYPPVRRGPERFALRVYDNQFELAWHQEIELPYPDNDFNIREYRVDPEGNVYVLGRYAPTQANGLRAPATYIILAYTRQGEQRTTYRIELEEVWVRGLSFRLAGNGDLACGGFYQSKTNPEEIGICHLRINPLSSDVHTIHLAALTDPALGEDLMRGHDFRMRELALRSDGGIVITAEQFTRQQATAFTYQGPAPLNYYSYQDILLANLSPDGTFSWVRRIPKLQTSVNDGGAYSSFAQATIADRFYFLFNDTEDRFQTRRRSQRSYLEPDQSVLTITEVDRKGLIRTKPLLLHADQDVITLPRWCRQIGPKQMLLYAVDGREYALGIVEF